ncbi:hypothetical protein [Actinomadura atramentaria]|uniref:hypothetical protein n=1 Tax=Actinomadura atramentaria TaxID=1990 RepID=UPI00036CD54A|nr:hypothetical protein [Actinomadura atramentaria]
MRALLGAAAALVLLALVLAVGRPGDAARVVLGTLVLAGAAAYLTVPAWLRGRPVMVAVQIQGGPGICWISRGGES